MAKASGIGQTTLSVADASSLLTSIKNDVTNWDISTPRAVQDVTGVDKSAIERLLLLADCSLTIAGVFNATGAHLIFRTVPSTSVVRATSFVVNGVTLAPNVLFTDYKLTRGANGALTYSAPGVLADGSVPTWS